MAEWESKPASSVKEAAVKAEAVAELMALEAQRGKQEPGLSPFFTSPPSISDDEAAIVELDGKVRALTTMYTLVNSSKLDRLRPQVDALTTAAPLEELQTALRKVQLLADVQSHMSYIRLVGSEVSLDLSSPLSDILSVHDTTSADYRLVKSFPECPMCKQHHAPGYVLEKHPHLKLKATGTTHLGGKMCCVTCAPYWD